MIRTTAAKLDDDAIEAANRLAAENLGLVSMVANRFGSDSHLDFEERVSAGYLGLIRASRDFDPNRKAQFSTYAVHWITAYIRRAIYEERLIPVPVYLQQRSGESHGSIGYARRAMGLSSLSGFRDNEGDDTDVDVAVWDEECDDRAEPLIRAAQWAIRRLDKQHRTILRRVVMNGEHLVDVASDMGLSRTKTARFRDYAIQCIRSALRKRFTAEQIHEMRRGA